MKFDYRNPHIWALLGELYTVKSQTGLMVEEMEFNIEKATFCFTKSAKYEALLSNECRALLGLIPKYIN